MAKILGSLPSKFSAFVTAWDNVDAANQTVSNLTTRLLKEEGRMSTMDELAESLSVTGINKPKNIQNFHKNLYQKNYHQDKNPKKKSSLQQSGSRQMSNIECYYCHKFGHVMANCRKRLNRAKNKDNDGVNDDSSNINAFVSESLIDWSVALNTDVKDAWIFDSGASKHMSHHRGWFSSFSTCDGDKVVLGDGTTCDVKGHGTIMIKTFVHNKWIDSMLQDVLFVPTLNKNLLSGGACMKRNYDVLFKKDRVEILSNGVLKAIGIKQQNNLFRMIFKVVPDEANTHTTSSLKIWHERLGHVGINVIHETMKKNLVDGASLTDNDNNFFCEACQMGKSHRLPFMKNVPPRNVKVGEFIHSDVAGPMQETSLGGSRFYVNFKDHVSSFRCIYFMKHKSDVLEKFKEYEAMVRNKFGHSIKILRVDNGKEFINSAMMDFMISHGILLETTAPYTPQQNGRSERDNRTIMESARTMLHASGLPLRLWAEAVNTAVYSLNRTSSSQVKDTPSEIWMSRRPNVAHMKIFGTIAFAHTPKMKRKKLDAKSRKMFFVGYQKESTNYRLYDPDTGQIVISREVVFNEKQIGNVSSHASGDNFSISLDDTQIIPDDLIQTVPNTLDEQEHCREHDQSDSNQEEDDFADAFQSPCLQERQQASNYNFRDRSSMVKPARYRANYTEYVEPASYEDAVTCDHKRQWQEAVNEELRAHEKNDTWILISLPKCKKVISSTWVFKIKHSPMDDNVRFKARLCARGFSQRAGIDFHETFAPVVRYDSVRILLALAAEMDLEIGQFDVKTAFLHGDIDEEIYMEVPKGITAKKGVVCKLNKSLYGLRQASRCWNVKFDSFLKKFNFVQSSADPCVYHSDFQSERAYLALYVDDGLILTSSQKLLDSILYHLKSTFEITEGKADYFVGLQIKRVRKDKIIIIHQQVYTETVLKRFQMFEAKPAATPIDTHVNLTLAENSENEQNCPFREAIGNLMFLAIVSRPDLAYAVGYVSRFLSRYSHEHWQAVKRILRYLKSTTRVGIVYRGNHNNFLLTGYSDSDYAGDLDTRRSTTGYLFCLSDGPITWCSQRQKVVALSTTESEFIAACAAAKEAIWLNRFLLDLKCSYSESVTLHVDNQRLLD